MNWFNFFHLFLKHCLIAFFLFELRTNHRDILVRSTDNRINNNEPSPARIREEILHGTSVWCFGETQQQRICKFKNLCYSTRLADYIFFHGESSVVSGVPHERCAPTLLDMSSVDDHNMQYFNYQDVPANSVRFFPNITMVNTPSLIFHRFNPDNLMHVIHDDLLPLFQTLKQFYPNYTNTETMFNGRVQLVFMEGRSEGVFYLLYQLFSDIQPMLGTFVENDALLCFTEVVVGITKVTTWYDYGFKVPQAPIKGHTASATIIHQFRKFVATKLNIVESDINDYIILLSRKTNRLILNEFELSVAIASTFNLKVMRLSLETNNLAKIIEKVYNSKGLVGMHGSLLSLAVFLKPGSFLVELFPYAVNPENYTPYKTLAELPGMDITYIAWSNKIKSNTVVHPNRAASVGGIAHLSTQQDILNAEIVPKHLCCNDPHWLFRIYQDTIVDIKSLLTMMQTALLEKQTEQDSGVKTLQLAHPGRIEHVNCTCLINPPAIIVSWKSSWNMQFFDQGSVEFEIWLQNQATQEFSVYALETKTDYTFTENIQQNTSYGVWVRGVIMGNKGPFSDICKCVTNMN